jgi:hypothetical protein
VERYKEEKMFDWIVFLPMAVAIAIVAAMGGPKDKKSFAGLIIGAGVGGGAGALLGSFAGGLVDAPTLGHDAGALAVGIAGALVGRGIGKRLAEGEKRPN